MRKVKDITSIFYTRGTNTPYTEGHIQVVRMMTRSLLLFGVKSLIFNFKYHINEPNYVEDNYVHKLRMDQKIPILTRDNVISSQSKSIVTYASLMEAIATLKFVQIEKRLKHDHIIVNVVNCFKYPRVLTKRLLKGPVISHYYIRPHNFYRCVISEILTKMIVSKSDAIIVSSHNLARCFEEYDIKKSKIVVIYPPIDTQLFKPMKKEATRSKLDMPKEAKIILYIGSLKTKRFPENIVLHALKNLVREYPETKLLIFTPRNNENITRKVEILRKAKKFNLLSNVEINVKNLMDKEKSMIYSEADIFLFPSLPGEVAVEPPLVILEAMASGLPVISSDILSVREIITDGTNGLLIPIENIEASHLAKKITSLVIDNKTMEKFSHEARQTIRKKASISVCGHELINVFYNLF